MAEFPALPLFTDAFIADTGHLDATETGAYVALLMAAWRSPDCALPDNDARLARMARCDTRTWNRVKTAVLAFWTKGEDGLLRQKRLSKEREYCNTSRLSKQAAAFAAHAVIRERKLLKCNKTVSAEHSAEHSAEGSAERLQPIPIPIKEEVVVAREDGRKPVTSEHRVIALDLLDTGKGKLDNWERGFLEDLCGKRTLSPVQQAKLEGIAGKLGVKTRNTAATWKHRLEVARQLQQWDAKWGPQPGTIGCLVPDQWLQANDGKGWTEWKAAG